MEQLTALRGNKNKAVILGNGPSLPRFAMQFSEVAAGATIFGVNRIFLAPEIFCKKIDVYLALDPFCYVHDLAKIIALHPSICLVSARYYDRFSMLTMPLVSFQLHADPFHFARFAHDSLDSSASCGHGYTSVYPCLQLAFLAGFSEIHLFGVDFKADTDGQSHFWGHVERRNRKTWTLGNKSVSQGLQFLRSRGINVTVHSDLFEELPVCPTSTIQPALALA